MSSPADPLGRLNEMEAPPRVPVIREDADISSTRDRKSRISVYKGPNVRLPQTTEEWKELAHNSLPWLAGAIILVAAATAYKQSKCEEEKDGMSYGELTRRKTRKGKEYSEQALEGGKKKVKRGWFRFGRKAEQGLEDAKESVNDAARAVSRKGRDAAEATKDKAHEAKESVKDAGWWASDKAQGAVDEAKSAYHHTADTIKGATQKVEEKVAGSGSSALATASSAEEKAGKAMKQTGESLEKDGARSKKYFSGEKVAAEEDKKKKGWGWWE